MHISKEMTSRNCMFCHINYLSSADPHIICKPCRQPDPQRFFCTESKCESCTIIRDHKLLSQVLHRNEMNRISQKLKPVKYSTKSKEKVLQLFEKKDRKDKDSKRDFVSDKEVLSPLTKAVEIKLTDTPKDHTYFNDIESKVYNKVMTSLFNSTKCSPVPERCSPQSTSSTSSTISADEGPNNSFESVSTSNEKEDLITISGLLSRIKPDCISFFSNPDESSGYIFKLSSEAGSILLNSFLTSPSNTDSLKENLNISGNPEFWPKNLELLKSIYDNDFYELPSMRLHPKVRNMQSVLFGDLDPILPSVICDDGFFLPPLSAEMKNKFSAAKKRLQRFLLIFSMIDYFQDFLVEGKIEEKLFLAQFQDQVKICLENEANNTGLLIQDIRRFLLADACCKEHVAIQNLIMGPIHQNQFFGPYVSVLHNTILRKGISYRIRSKRPIAKLILPKLPMNIIEMKLVNQKDLNRLNSYFTLNKLSNENKVILFLYILPNNLKIRMENFIKPEKIIDQNFENISNIFDKVTNENCSNIMCRKQFCSRVQGKKESILMYAESLENLWSSCNYGSMANELLRDKFIFGLNNKELQDSLLEKPYLCYEECRSKCFKFACENMISKMEDDLANFKEEKCLRSSMNKSNISADVKLTVTLNNSKPSDTKSDITSNILNTAIRSDESKSSIKTNVTELNTVANKNKGNVSKNNSTSAITKSDTKSAITKSDTKSAMTKSDTKSAITKSDTKSAITKSDTKSAITKSDTKSAITKSDTKSAITKSDTKSAITKSDTKFAMTKSDTKSAITKSDTKFSVVGSKSHACKRKSEDDKSSKLPKKQCLDNIKINFIKYNVGLSRAMKGSKLIDLDDVKLVREKFAFNRPHNYEIFCPFTGMALRA